MSTPKPLRISKIISGGQTGVDRAALDFSLKNNIVCGGFCPKERKAEDGTISDKYPLIETSSSNYAFRTEKNVQVCDGTLIFYHKTLDRGTSLTLKLLKKHHKPFFEIDLSCESDKKLIVEWLINHQIKILNISGPRESHCPGIYEMTLKMLEKIFCDSW
ncbi:MAG: putative molybdenum carrier protein [Bacteroidales bacterium]|nr:putative molybdenum carrier protein [Bacteroidales bacterium]